MCLAHVSKKDIALLPVLRIEIHVAYAVLASSVRL